MSNPAFSVLGVFDSPQQLLDAIPAVKACQPGRLEAYTPYPVHGLASALGLRKSPVGGMVFVMGLIGAISALGFELWVQGADYPVVTAGKPFFSWQAFIPVMFEVTVLFACFTSGLGMLLLLNRLPSLRHPMLRSRAMPGITRDKFVLAAEANGQRLDVDRIMAALREAGAHSIEVLEEPPARGLPSPNFLMQAVLGIGLSCLAAGYLTYWAMKLFPVVIPMSHMLEQPRLDPQKEDGFFADGAGMRRPVEGTVAHGSLPFRIGQETEAAGLANPLPRSQAVLAQGRRGFNTYCAVCHGILGNGATSLTAAYGAKPANLVSDQIRRLSDGEIYFVITRGKNAMPSYAADLSPDERWPVVHYLRALQRSQNALDSDVPREAGR